MLNFLLELLSFMHLKVGMLLKYFIISDNNYGIRSFY